MLSALSLALQLLPEIMAAHIRKTIRHAPDSSEEALSWTFFGTELQNADDGSAALSSLRSSISSCIQATAQGVGPLRILDFLNAFYNGSAQYFF